MAFLTIQDAQILAVNKVIERYNLEKQYATYNDFNDSGKVIRNGLKNQIRLVQKDVDSANKYLNANLTKPLLYSTNLFDVNLNVYTPWENEAEIPNTVKYYLATLPTGTIPEFTAIQGINNLLLGQVNTDIQTKQAKVDQITQTGPNDSTKTVLLNDANLDLDQSEALAAAIEAHNKEIENAKNSILTPTDNTPSLSPTDTSIRQSITDNVTHKVGYKNQLDVESTVVMRKKVLDAFYTAKTPDEKALAERRLELALQASGPDVPITRSSLPYDPARYLNLSTQLTEVNDEIITLQTQISVTTDPTQLAILNAMLDQKNKQKLILNDLLNGFQDSKIPSTSYFGSFTTTEIAPIPNNTGVSYNVANADAETNEITRQRNMPNNSPRNDQSVDLVTGAVVNKNNGNYSAAGRYVDATDPNKDELIKSLSDQKKIQAQQEYDIELKRNQGIIDSATLARNETLDDLNAKATDLQNQKAQQTDPEKQKALDIQLQQVQIDRQAALDTYSANTETASNNITKASNVYASDINNIESGQAQLNNTAIPPATPESARKVVNDFDNSVAAQDQSQIELSKQLKIAENNARTNNPGQDPTLSANWSQADKDKVQAAINKSNDAAATQKDAAAQLELMSSTEAGRQAIAGAGVNSQKLDARLNANGTNAASNIVFGNNTITGNVSDANFSSTQVTSQLESSNIRPDTGFEGINNGAPFYLQMPTLNSLGDFKLANGISPYGKRGALDVARDAVHFNIFEITPPAPKATTDSAGLVVNDVDAAKSNTLGVFTIYPTNSDYLNFSHKHTYNDEDRVASSINQVLGTVNTADTLLSLGATVLGSSQRGQEQGVNSIVQRRIESISTYSGTAKQSITIDFVLFTKNDFIRDVFRPIMFLTSLSYPKRTTSGNFANIGQAASKATQKAALNAGTPDSIRSLLLASGVKAEEAGKLLDNLENKFSRYGGIGPYRYYVSRRPEYMSIRHASGLFTFPLAYIDSVDYSFQGPWYNFNGDPLSPNGELENTVRNSVAAAAASKGFLDSISDAFKNAFENAGTSKSKTNNPQTTFINPMNPGSLTDRASKTFKNDTAYYNKYSLPYAYPSWAKISITVSNALPMFRDDFLESFYAGGGPNPGNGLVTVSEKQAGFASNLNLANGVSRANGF